MTTRRRPREGDPSETRGGPEGDPSETRATSHRAGSTSSRTRTTASPAKKPGATPHRPLASTPRATTEREDGAGGAHGCAPLPRIGGTRELFVRPDGTYLIRLKSA